MCNAEISKEIELLSTQFSFGWLAKNSHPASILANFHFSQLKDVQSLQVMSPRAPWEAQVPPLLLSPTQCSFPAEFLWASHDAFSHTLQSSPLKPQLDFLLHWNFLKPVMWNSMKLAGAASDPMISLVPACCLLSVPETQQLLLLLLLCTSSFRFCRQKTRIPIQKWARNQIRDQFRWQETTPTIWSPSKENKEHHHFNSQISLDLHHPRLPINMPS